MSAGGAGSLDLAASQKVNFYLIDESIFFSQIFEKKALLSQLNCQEMKKPMKQTPILAKTVNIL